MINDYLSPIPSRSKLRWDGEKINIFIPLSGQKTMDLLYERGKPPDLKLIPPLEEKTLNPHQKEMT